MHLNFLSQILTATEYRPFNLLLFLPHITLATFRLKLNEWVASSIIALRSFINHSLYVFGSLDSLREHSGSRLLCLLLLPIALVIVSRLVASYACLNLLVRSNNCSLIRSICRGFALYHLHLELLDLALKCLDMDAVLIHQLHKLRLVIYQSDHLVFFTRCECILIDNISFWSLPDRI